MNNYNKMDNQAPLRTCEKCMCKITYKNYARHLKTKKHNEVKINVKELKTELKWYGMKNVDKMKKSDLLVNKDKIKAINIDREKLLKLSKKKLIEFIQDNNFNINKQLRKDQIVERLLDFHSNKTLPLPKWEFVDENFKSRHAQFDMKNNWDIKDMSKFLHFMKKHVSSLLQEWMKKHSGIKVNFCVSATYVDTRDETKIAYKHLQTKNDRITNRSELTNGISTLMKSVLDRHENIIDELTGSPWRIISINSFRVNINKYDPLRASSYIDLPKILKDKKAIINVKNTDNKCFLWSLLACLYPAKDNPQEIIKYKAYEKTFDKALKDIEFPMKIKDIEKFENKVNELKLVEGGLSINVYHHDDRYKIYPLHITKEEKTKHVDLLYLCEESNDRNTHYCWIKDLTKLIKSQLTKNTQKIHFLCKRCLCHFYSEVKYLEHRESCKVHDPVAVKLPLKSDNICEFTNYNRSMKIPFTIIADFECILRKLEKTKVEEDAKTQKIQEHVPISCVYYILYENGEISENMFEYFGSNTPQVLCEKLSEDAYHDDQTLTDRLEKLELDLKEKLDDEEKNKKKVQDHDHITGEYRGAAHSLCNLNYNVPSFIPVLFHNFSGYDSHLLVKEFAGTTDNLKLIPNNEESYISFSKVVKFQHYSGKEGKIELRFLDSYKFLSEPLSKLAKNLEMCHFKNLKKWFDNTVPPGNDSLFNLLTEKLAYPYDYMDSLEKYDEEELPSRGNFYNSLNDEHVDEQEFLRAQKIWEHFNIKNLKEFTMLYNKIDVLLLADVIENFRKTALEIYKLDPLWYYTTPGFAWDCMLKTTKQKLELITDVNMLYMFENAKRGGISQCSNRYEKANHKYMGEKFDKNKESTFIQYLDANNLYGWAMSKHLPYGGFWWANPNDFTYSRILKMRDNQSKGYLFEVDLSYPETLHDYHSDLPYCAENIIDENRLPKLFTTLYDKKKYVLHYLNLRQALEAGLKLEKIHRVIQFNQSDWMKVYIDKNTKHRQNAKNEFEKDFFKLMNNSVFGRTMMNVRNHVDIKLISEGKKYTKLKREYKNDVKLLYTDTDSLILSIKTPDFYSDMKGMIDEFDTSDYPENNIYGIPQVNKKVIGKFKDEMKGKSIEEFIGLASKLYSIKVFEEDEKKRAKGVKKHGRNQVIFPI
ncbi:uncharacterized protein LOC135834592 [Planococcus citri]|uniref:uncharacterized protein LOC135834592 n=1 Tax=Planococcus citri TaxID=170843 RepID=UPI0031FA1949